MNPSSRTDRHAVGVVRTEQTEELEVKEKVHNIIPFPTFVKDWRQERKTEKKNSKKKEAKTKKENKEKGKEKEESSVLFHAALFHSGTPLVARSTAEAASQSPLPVYPVTLHHWGQRALCLPINEPASASVPLCTPQTPTIQWETEIKQKKKEIFSAAP